MIKKKILIERIKSLIPNNYRITINKNKFRLYNFFKRNLGKSNQKIFNDIYTNAVWGRDKEGEAFSGSGSHYSIFTKPYIENLIIFLKDKKLKTIVDLGCGDFNIGKNFLDFCENFIACDVSNIILDKNIQKFKFNKLKFLNIDITKDDLPDGDLAFVRQVLQHLSNHDIKKFLFKLKKTNYKYLIVTEGLPVTKYFTPNLDKPSDNDIRISHLDSGVELHHSPFNLEFKKISTLLEVKNDEPNNRFNLKTTLYEL